MRRFAGLLVVWGGITDTVASPDDQAHLPFVARTADEQVGRIVARLRELGQLDETLIVLTTDHAGQPSKRYHGVDGPGRGDFNWYDGETLNARTSRLPRRSSPCWRPATCASATRTRRSGRG